MLTRRFTPLHMLFLSINGIIGSAWLFAPLYSAKIAGGAALISWLIGGGATILIALTFAELSTCLPVAGGTTRFAQLSHGTTTGFIISWISWLSCVTMPPIEVQAVLQYSSAFLPNLHFIHLVNDVPVLTWLGLFFATLIMLGLCVLNIVSFRGFVRFNFFIFSFKIVVIMLTIIFLIKTQFHPLNFALAATSAHHDGVSYWEAILTAVATGGIAFAFTGFKHGVELAGETTQSQRSIPLAIVGSVVVCLILYVGLQIAFIGALDSSALAHGWSGLSFKHDIGPFFGIAVLLGLGVLAKLLLVDAAVSPLGAGLIYVTSTARIVYAMSCNGYLSPLLSRVNQESFPVWAILFNFVIGMLLFLPLPGWQNMVSFLVSAVVISYAMGPIVLMCLRRQLPTQPRPFYLPCAHLICLLAFYSCNLISYWTGWNTLWKLALAIIVGVMCFVLARLRDNKQRHTDLDLKALLWLAPYLGGLVLISYLGAYGGGINIIKFGWDFLIIALFTVFIFYLAIATRLPRKAVEQQVARYQREEQEGDKNNEFVVPQRSLS